MAKGYTLDELLIIVAAREMKNDENVILGIGIPMIAGALAKALHAPDANLMMESGMIDIEPLVKPNHIADVMSCRGFGCATDLYSAFTMTYRGFVDVCFLGVGQIDKFGNLNTTAIGDYYNPDLRLPGSGGAPDFMAYAGRTILTMRAGEFVEKLDYLTSPGYLEGGNAREASGMFRPNSGPKMMITTQGVFSFDEDTKEIYLSKIHPGVDLTDITKKVPWELKIADDLQVTEPPNEREIDFIRRFSPNDSVGKNVSMELIITKAMNEIAAK